MSDRVDCPLCGQFLTLAGIDPVEPWGMVFLPPPLASETTIETCRPGYIKSAHLRCIDAWEARRIEGTR